MTATFKKEHFTKLEELGFTDVCSATIWDDSLGFWAKQGAEKYLIRITSNGVIEKRLMGLDPWILVYAPLLEQLKLMVRQDEDLTAAGFTCLGLMTNLYTLPEDFMKDYYRTWIWENKEGFRVAAWDEGNTWCHVFCEGTEKKLRELNQVNTKALMKEMK